jgi:hypothetical protein
MQWALRGIGKGLAALSLLGLSAAASAQVQNLTISFQPAGGPPPPTVTAAPVPLSDWLSAAVAVAIALTAFVILRRRKLHGRFFGWTLALVAAASMFAITDQRLIGEAYAAGPVAILDLTSPTLNVAPFVPNAAVSVVVTNNTGQSIKITRIDLDSGPYNIMAQTCFEGLVMAATVTCTVTLELSPP